MPSVMSSKHDMDFDDDGVVEDEYLPLGNENLVEDDVKAKLRQVFEKFTAMLGTPYDYYVESQVPHATMTRLNMSMISAIQEIWSMDWLSMYHRAADS